MTATIHSKPLGAVGYFVNTQADGLPARYEQVADEHKDDAGVMPLYAALTGWVPICPELIALAQDHLWDCAASAQIGAPYLPEAWATGIINALTTPPTIPAEVLRALDRMCSPLDASVLAGATAAADAQCMSVIRDYVLAGRPGTRRDAAHSDCEQRPLDDAAIWQLSTGTALTLGTKVCVSENSPYGAELVGEVFYITGLQVKSDGCTIDITLGERPGHFESDGWTIQDLKPASIG